VSRWDGEVDVPYSRRHAFRANCAGDDSDADEAGADYRRNMKKEGAKKQGAILKTAP
jgi:hypothetical protein